MNFCEKCGVLIVPTAEQSECENCAPSNGAQILSRKSDATGTELERLSSTKSGSIRKADAMEWLHGLDRPSPTDLRRSILPKPAGFEGSTFETDISNFRITGDARFIETIAGLLTPILDLENDETRVELNLQRTRVRDTKEYTGNYALYLSVAQRGGT